MGAIRDLDASCFIGMQPNELLGGVDHGDPYCRVVCRVGFKLPHGFFFFFFLNDSFFVESSFLIGSKPIHSCSVQSSRVLL